MTEKHAGVNTKIIAKGEEYSVNVKNSHQSELMRDCAMTVCSHSNFFTFSGSISNPVLIRNSVSVSGRNITPDVG